MLLNTAAMMANSFDDGVYTPITLDCKLLIAMRLLTIERLIGSQQSVI